MLFCLENHCVKDQQIEWEWCYDKKISALKLKHQKKNVMMRIAHSMENFRLEESYSMERFQAQKPNKLLHLRKKPQFISVNLEDMHEQKAQFMLICLPVLK